MLVHPSLKALEIRLGDTGLQSWVICNRAIYEHNASTCSDYETFSYNRSKDLCLIIFSATYTNATTCQQITIPFYKELCNNVANKRKV